jgi:hypothetical protein
VALLVPKGKRNRENKLYLSGTALVRLLDQNKSATASCPQGKAVRFPTLPTRLYEDRNPIGGSRRSAPVQNKAKYPRFHSIIKDFRKNKPKIEAKRRSSEASAKEDKANLILGFLGSLGLRFLGPGVLEFLVVLQNKAIF